MARYKERLFFIGPDVWSEQANPLFSESDTLFADWKAYALQKAGVSVRTGVWEIPGRPVAFLVDFRSFYAQKNEIYARAWEQYQVDSLHAYGDYDEASMFAYAVGKTVESFYHYYLGQQYKVVFQAHEWMTGLSALYLKTHVPEIATIFTTHATSIGRSIAGNNKPLYDYLSAYNGDQMAGELNMQSKHSIEKQTAHHVDCFTTVSDITDAECAQLLEKHADVVLKNGFEDDFLPQTQTAYTAKRKVARKTLLKVAGALTGTKLTDQTLIVGIGGRYEMKNKGIDIFIEALHRLAETSELQRHVLAVISVPADVAGVREDLQSKLKLEKSDAMPLDMPCLTHWLRDPDSDRIMTMLRQYDMVQTRGNVTVMFVPCYLNGNDGIFNLSYYDLLVGQDVGVYPSYYEPWGYTPLESAAFKVPTITTDLAGFGRWVSSLTNEGIAGGVEVVHRTDNNYFEVAEAVKQTLLKVAGWTAAERKSAGAKAAGLADQAQWKYFINDYYAAYDVALNHAAHRRLEYKY